MKQRLQQIFPWLVSLLICAIPSNLFLVLNESQGYVNGFRIDYLLPKLFLTDLIIILVVLVGGYLQWKKIQQIVKNIFSNKVFLVLITALLVAQCFATIPAVSFYTLLKYLEYSILLLVVSINWKKIPTIFISAAIAVSLTIQAVFASYQHISGRSLTPYKLFGESQLNESMIGLARGSFNGVERLLAYGTTPHPNILAGITILLSLILISQFKTKKILVALIMIENALMLYLTQSWSAFLALILGLIGIYAASYIKPKISNIIIFLTLLTPLLLLLLQPLNSPSITRRVVLDNVAMQAFLHRPIAGVGLGNFTAVVEKMMISTEFVRFIQPAHNVALLLIAETGLIGILLTVEILRKFNNTFQLQPVALALIPLLALDHYLITSQVGVLSLIIFLVSFTKKIRVKD